MEEIRMGGALLSIASQVPWGMLIDRMPEIIDGASRLLQTTGVMRKKIPVDVELIAAGTNQVDPNKLKITVDALEASLLGLNKQMNEAAILIKDLAETNKELVRAGNLHRKWLFRIAALAIVSLSLALVLTSVAVFELI